LKQFLRSTCLGVLCVGVCLTLSGCLAHWVDKSRFQPDRPQGLTLATQYDSTILANGFVLAFHQYSNGVCIKEFGDNPYLPTATPTPFPNPTPNPTPTPTPTPLKIPNSIAVELQYQQPCKHTDQQIRAVRNEIIEAIRVEVDENYGNFISSLHVARAGTSIFFDVATLGVTTASTVTGDKAVSEMLTAAASGLLGTRTSIDKNLFDDQARQAIIAQMDASRTAVANEVEKGESGTLADYPLEKALTDMRRYYQTGTLIAALQAIGAEAGAKKIDEDQNRQDIRKGNAVVGNLLIESDPSSATIKIDQQVVAKTPALVSVKPGKHTIEYSLEGYTTWSEEKDVSGTRVVTTGHTLVPVPVPVAAPPVAVSPAVAPPAPTPVPPPPKSAPAPAPTPSPGTM
jgi:hypothetical protein